MQPVIDSIVTVPTTALDVHYRDWGGHGSGVILVHGLASSARIYDLCAPLLTANHRVVAYDQRGHGYSAKLDMGYDFETLVSDGRGLARSLGVTPPYTIVGHSWGASVALQWAVRHPDEVRSIVLVDGGIFSFRDMPGASWESVSERLAPPDHTGRQFEDLLERTRRGDLAFLDEPFRREFFAALMHVMPDGTYHPRLSRSRHMAILRSMWDMDLEAAYDALRRPALALVALPRVVREDQGEMAAMRRQAVERLAARQALLTVRWVPDTIHDLPLQRPEVLAEAILGFAGSD
jgi:pimeloyl-ACP methyl ester carboxylesterase